MEVNVRGITRDNDTCHETSLGLTTDMSDEEWQVIKSLMPWPVWLHGNGGRPEKYCRRLIMDAIRYVVDNGCKWRNLPADFLVPWRTRPCDLHSLVAGR